MSIVTLQDGTTYNINTDSYFDAKHIVTYKLRNRLDFRKIKDIKILRGCTTEDNSKSAYDGVELKCNKGWSYKWSN